MSRNVLLGAIGAGLLALVTARHLGRASAAQSSTVRQKGLRQPSSSTLERLRSYERVPWSSEPQAPAALVLALNAVGPLAEGVHPEVAATIVRLRHLLQCVLAEAPSATRDDRAKRLAEGIAMATNALTLIAPELDRSQAA